MPKISVIVPVYKVEKYLNRCVDSILNQTFTDFELILVDDGSPDNCGKICDEYAVKDNRVVVIHQKNAGASNARNNGIKIARGEYLAFCDSDDVVSSMWLQRLIRFAKPNVLPIGAYCQDKDSLCNNKRLSIEEDKEYNKNLYYQFAQCGIAGYLWNALYCRDIVANNSIALREKHSEGDYNEDLIFTLSYVRHIDKLVYTGYTDYCYDNHNDSLSHSDKFNYFKKYSEKFRLWLEFIKEYSSDVNEIKKLADSYLYYFLTALQQELTNYNSFKSIVNSGEMQFCVNNGNCSKENKFIINMIKKKRTFTLWMFYRLNNIKRRIVK